MDKQLYIIAGCNGAGKTTASYTVLPEILNCREFVNADEIAHGLSPFNHNSSTPRQKVVVGGRTIDRIIYDAKKYNQILNYV
jgi:predicted ABC-type ATPase